MSGRHLTALLLALALFAPAAHADCPNFNSGTVGSTGTTLGLFNNPQRCASDLATNLYVVDTGNSRVQKLTAATSVWSAVGTAGSGTGQFNNPRAVAVDSLGFVYVADTNNNRIQKFTSALTYVSAWGSAGSGNGQFSGAQGICVDPTDTYVYVAEYGNNRIQKFTTAGAYVTQWASASATDVCCDPAGNVYVSSYGASHVTKYAGTGAVLATIGAPGSGNGQLSGAQGVAVDRYGNLYVADGGNVRIEKFSTAGTWLASLVTSNLTNAFGVAVDTSGALWATDGTLNHLLKFVPVVSSIVTSGNRTITYGAPSQSLTVNEAPTGAFGTLNLFDNGVVIATQSISYSGNSFPLGTPAAGTHVYTVQVTNPGSCIGVTSAPATYTVSKAPVSATFTESPPSGGIGQPVVSAGTFSNGYGGYSGTPTGTVQYSVDGAAYGSPVTLATGVASTAITFSSPGTHSLAISYSGDANFVAVSGSIGSYTVLAPVPMPALATYWSSPGYALPQAIGAYGDPAFDASDNVYLADHDNNRLLVFDRNGNLVRTWGSLGSGAGQFSGPMGVAVDGSGNVFVTEATNNRVQKFSGNGTYVTQWGTAGTGIGQFTAPGAIAVDGAGDVYVTDQNARVQEFSGSGAFIRSWGTGDASGSAPLGLAVRGNGDVLLADWPDNRVQEFGNLGAPMTQYGSGGYANGQFHVDEALALDAAGNTWVTDFNNYRIQKFSPAGAWLGTVGTSGLSPVGIGVDHSGFVYVTDPPDGLVLKYALLPSVTSVKDVGNDQGRAVRLHFTPDNSDFATAAFPTTGYEVYRRINAIAGAQRAGSAARAGRANPAGVQVAGWDYVLTVPATGDTAYNVVVPTLADSNQTGLNSSVFFVRGATAQPGVYYDSPADSGWSVDNLPPAVPAPFTAARVSGSTYLHWGANSESDFWYYRLYRGSDPAFTPGPASLVASRSDTGYVDAGASASSTYKLTAVDVNGNESSPAVVSPSGTTAVGGEGPLAFGLERIRPNPTTSRNLTVSFALASDVPARVELLDVAGRVVAARDVVGAGRRTLDLAAGTHVAPGLYLVRLSQGGQHRTERVAVVE